MSQKKARYHRHARSQEPVERDNDGVKKKATVNKTLRKSNQKAGKGKPPLARAYDKMMPGEYTRKQDFKHALFLFVLIAILMCSICVIACSQVHKAKYATSDKLVIPNCDFVYGQESTVISMLEGYGFKNVQEDDSGNILGYGTPEMVNAYQDSFYDKNMKRAEELRAQDHTGLGIVSINVSNDSKTVTINTIMDYNSSSAFSSISDDPELQEIVRAYAIWGRMVNDGDPVTFKFVNVMNLSDGANGTQYYESQEPTLSRMQASMEKAESSQANGTSQNQNESSAQNPNNSSNDTEAPES